MALPKCGVILRTHEALGVAPFPVHRLVLYPLLNAVQTGSRSKPRKSWP